MWESEEMELYMRTRVTDGPTREQIVVVGNCYSVHFDSAVAASVRDWQVRASLCSKPEDPP